MSHTNLTNRWKTLEEILAEKNIAERECSDCKQIKRCLNWGSLWLCGKCIDESTIEGIIQGDRIIPRFSQEYREITLKRINDSKAGKH